MMFQVLSIVLGIYCFLILLDCLTVKRKLKNILNEDKVRKAQSSLNFCYTMVGKMLMRLTESTQYKVAVLNWQAENNLLNSISSQVINQESEKLGSFFQGLLSALFSRLRVETVFVITTVQDSNQKIEVQHAKSRSSHQVPPKLLKYIVNFYHSYFRQNDNSLLGLRDGFQSKSLSGEFYLFGYRHILALPLNYRNHAGQTVKGLLWLGYNKNTEPYPHELAIAKEACQKIEREFASQRIIDELSSKVKEEKVISKQRDEFLAHVSHDIRSPLNNIRSIINLLKLESTDNEELELLETALGNCYDVEEIINAILDFTKFQAGHLENRKEAFDINFLLEEVVSNQKVEAKLKNLKLTLNYDPSMHLLLDADRKQIKRVLNNLVSNAVKYTRFGTVEVEVKEAPEGSCLIQVKDTGVGMTQEQLSLLFTPFYRFHMKEAEGIGLGLALSKILTELNGGRIRVESIANKGSIFEISFPYHKKIERGPSHASLNVVTPRQGPQILVLDDNASVVESLSRMLRKLNFNVVKCYTVSDAMSILNFSPPDYLISDWSMPDGGAKRLIKYMQLIQARTKICLLTGSNIEEVKKEIHGFGVERIFCKSEDFEKMQDWLSGLRDEPAPAYDLLSAKTA